MMAVTVATLVLMLDGQDGGESRERKQRRIQPSFTPSIAWPSIPDTISVANGREKEPCHGELDEDNSRLTIRYAMITRCGRILETERSG